MLQGFPHGPRLETVAFRSDHQVRLQGWGGDGRRKGLRGGSGCGGVSGFRESRSLFREARGTGRK